MHRTILYILSYLFAPSFTTLGQFHSCSLWCESTLTKETGPCLQMTDDWSSWFVRWLSYEAVILICFIDVVDLSWILSFDNRLYTIDIGRYSRQTITILKYLHVLILVLSCVLFLLPVRTPSPSSSSSSPSAVATSSLELLHCLVLLSQNWQSPLSLDPVYDLFLHFLFLLLSRVHPF